MELRRSRGDEIEMMRTVEIILVIMILLGAFLIASNFAVLPSPRRVSPLNLEKLALTTLQTLDSDHSLSETVFKPTTDPSWGQLQIALASCLPPNIVYNLTTYDVSGESGELYTLSHSVSNAQSLGTSSEASSYLAASSNVTFNVTPEKINKTLYILNCSDSNGWWITGYTVQTLAEDLHRLLNSYFQITITVNSTIQLEQLLKGNRISTSPDDLQKENVTEAVIINTCGEAVPIPSLYVDAYGSELWRYCYQLGKNTTTCRWTWVSIVGWPFYYVTNTQKFTGSNDNNGWGIYGMKQIGSSGFGAFLRGINGQSASSQSSETKDVGTVQLSSTACDFTNKYGIYPPFSQTATRAVNSTIQAAYNLTATAYVFDAVSKDGETWIAGATFEHRNTMGQIDGKIIPIGLARTPDVRISALALLCYYKPELTRSQYTAEGTSKLIVLQLAYSGGT